MKIYVKFKKPRTIKQFLVSFFSEKEDGVVLNITTYFDKKCTKIQCESHRNRSFDEVYDCVKTYYKSATTKSVLINLMKLHPVNENGTVCNFTNTYCGGIQKSVMYYYTGSGCYYNIPNKELCNYSWKELFQMIGINSQKELDKYMKNNK